MIGGVFPEGVPGHGGIVHGCRLNDGLGNSDDADEYKLAQYAKQLESLATNHNHDADFLLGIAEIYHIGEWSPEILVLTISYHSVHSVKQSPGN